MLTVGKEGCSDKKGSTVVTCDTGGILFPHLGGGDTGVCTLHENSETLT